MMVPTPRDETCGICEDPVEVGEKAYVLAVGHTTDEGELDVSRLRVFHAGCGTVADARPPPFHLWSGATAVHAMTVVEASVTPGEPIDATYRPVCGVDVDVDDEDVVTLRPEGGSFETAVTEAGWDRDRVCGNCSRMVGGPNPMSEGGIPWRR